MCKQNKDGNRYRKEIFKFFLNIQAAYLKGMKIIIINRKQVSDLLTR